MNARSSIKVRQVLTPMPEPIDGLATVREAIERMKAADVRALVIKRRHEGDEFGLVGVSDIANEVIAKNRSIDRTNVYEIMTKPVLAIDADMDVKYAIRLLSRFKLSRCLVTDNKELAGIVTLHDMVFRYLEASEAPSGKPAGKPGGKPRPAP